MMPAAPVSSLFGDVGVPLLVHEATAREPTDRVRVGAVKISFALSGWSQVSTDTETIFFPQGAVLTIPAEVECWGLPAGWLRTVTFYVHPGYLQDQVRWLTEAHPLVNQLRNALAKNVGFQLLHFSRATMHSLAPFLARVARLPNHSEQDFQKLALTSSLFDAVGQLAGSAPATTATCNERIPRSEIVAAMELLRNNMSRRWRIEDLAAAVALSRSQLNRLFQTQVGLSPAAYLSRLRSDRMAELLVTTPLSVSDAASLAGWSDLSVASRAFKRRYGLSPRIYAQHARRQLLGNSQVTRSEGQLAARL